MHTGFARCRIETSGKNVLLATDMLNNAHLNQTVQARLHLLVQWSFMVQSINHKEILGGQQLRFIFLYNHKYAIFKIRLRKCNRFP